MQLIVFFSLTEYIINWYLTSGPVAMFGTMAGISFAITITTLPLYIFGKRYRLLWHNHNLIKILRLETDKTGSEE